MPISKRQGLHWLWALLLYTQFINVSHASQWQLYTEQNPPLSYTQNGQIKGFTAELAKALLARLKQSGDIQLLPWARAYHTAQQNKNSVLLITIRTPEREHSFKWVGPVFRVDVGFYALKHHNVTIDSLSDVAQLPKIGALRGWFSYDELIRMDLKNVVGVTSVRQLFRILLHGRVHVIAADNFSAPTQLQAFGISPDDLELVLPLQQVYGYLAFNKDTTDEDIARWQQALDAMKSSEEFSRLYQQWLPELPPPELTGISP